MTDPDIQEIKALLNEILKELKDVNGNLSLIYTK